MTLWLIAVLLLVSLCIVGYYQGAIRGACTLLGLIAASFLAVPFGKLFELLLPVTGLKHPVLVALVAPLIGYLIILILFKTAGFLVHRKVDTYYKYQALDTKRMLWERLSQRVGSCLGVANATVYFFLICLLTYLLGYFTVQVATSSNDHWSVRLLNVLARDLEKTGMVRAIAPFNPAPRQYYLGADILGDIFHNPLFQRRLSTYPPFLLVAERSEFEAMAKDMKFQEFWQRQPTVAEFARHEHIRPLIENIDFYKEVLGLVGSDMPDLKIHLATGQSPNYSGERILGRWDFDRRDTVVRARRRKPNMGTTDIRRLRAFLTTVVGDAKLTATLNHQIILRAAAGKKEGKWKSTATGSYVIALGEGNVEASVTENTLSFVREGVPLVFNKQ